MVNYEVAFKRPFSDLKKLLIAVLLNILPIVNFVVYGYFLEIARSSGKKAAALPEWKDFGKLFLNGFFALVIGLLYLLPVIAVMAILFASAHISMLSYMHGGPSFESFAPAFSGLGVWLLLILVLLIALAYILPLAVLSFALTGEFSSAFELGRIVKKTLTSEYFVVWLVSIVYSAVLGGLLGLVPWVGKAAAGAVTGITMFTLLGEIYPTLGSATETKTKGSKKVKK